jgi:hypothetical protein
MFERQLRLVLDQAGGHHQMAGDGLGIALVQTQQIAPHTRIQLGGQHVIGECGLVGTRRTTIGTATRRRETGAFTTASTIRSPILIGASAAPARIGLVTAIATALPTVTVTTLRTVGTRPRFGAAAIVAEGTRRSPAVTTPRAAVVTAGTITVPPRAAALAIGSPRILTSRTAAVSARGTIPPVLATSESAILAARPTRFTPVPGPSYPAAITTALTIGPTTPETATVLTIGATTLKSTTVSTIRTATLETATVLTIGTATPESTTVLTIRAATSETAAVAALGPAGTGAVGVAGATAESAAVLLVRAIRIGTTGITSVGIRAPQSTGPSLLATAGIVTPTIIGPVVTPVAAERFAIVVLLRHGGPFL